MRINIDKLNIRLKGIALDQARLPATNMGEALIRQIAGQLNNRKKYRSMTFPEIDAGSITMKPDFNAEHLPRIIAGRLSESIVSQINRQTGRKDS